MIQRYEILMLAVPEVTQDEIVTIEKHIDTIVREAKGSTLSFDRWGKFKLAYPVNKNDYGVYLLTRFELPQGTNALDEIKSLFVIKLNTIVMRNMIYRLDEKETLLYHRPKSLEEMPEVSDARNFVRDHKKIEGLISAVESSVPKVGDRRGSIEEDFVDISDDISN